MEQEADLSAYCRATEMTSLTLYCSSSSFASAAFRSRCCTVATDRSFKCRVTYRTPTDR